jgi:hypothetical protein
MVVAPTELTMGDIQRIFYYHVPSAFVAFTCFFANAVASVWYLARRSPAVDAFAVATAEAGVVFCTIVLITGPLWAKPVWGIWWSWDDKRLTSTLLLWVIYVAYLMLRRFAAAGQAPVLSAALSVFGALDVVFVYFSIIWFRRVAVWQHVRAHAEAHALCPPREPGERRERFVEPLDDPHVARLRVRTPIVRIDRLRRDGRDEMVAQPDRIEARVLRDAREMRERVGGREGTVVREGDAEPHARPSHEGAAAGKPFAGRASGAARPSR